MRRAALILGLLAASIPHARLAGLPSYNEQFVNCQCPTVTTLRSGSTTPQRCQTLSGLRDSCSIDEIEEDRCTVMCGDGEDPRHLLYSTVGTKNIEVPGRKVRCNDTNGIVTAVGNGDDYTAATQYNCVKLKVCNHCAPPTVDNSNCPADTACEDRIISYIDPTWGCRKYKCSAGTFTVRDAAKNKVNGFYSNLHCAVNGNLYNSSSKGETTSNTALGTNTVTCTANLKTISCPDLPALATKPANVTFTMDNTKIQYDKTDPYRGGSVFCKDGFALYSVSNTQPTANYTLHTTGGFLTCGTLGLWNSGPNPIPTDLKIFCVNDASVLTTTTTAPTTSQPATGGQVTYTHVGGTCAGQTFEHLSGGGISFVCNGGVLTLFCPGSVYIQGDDAKVCREVDRTSTALQYKLYYYPTGDETINPGSAPVFFCGAAWQPEAPHVTPAPSTCVSGSTEFTIEESGAGYYMESCIGDQQILGCVGGASLYVSGGTFVIANMDAGFTKVAYLGGGEWLASNCETKSAKVFTTLAIRCVAP